MPRHNKNARSRLIGLCLRFSAYHHRRIYGGENGRKEPSGTARRTAHIGATNLFEEPKPILKMKEMQ